MTTSDLLPIVRALDIERTKCGKHFRETGELDPKSLAEIALLRRKLYRTNVTNSTDALLVLNCAWAVASNAFNRSDDDATRDSIAEIILGLAHIERWLEIVSGTSTKELGLFAGVTMN